ncbi:putative GTP cyclohydrolase 1 type 2 [Caloramator mitchellensis]|uniref:GTP cyclohydrolase 1 type 2 homolog n=1 Tax=Caloramator mitchellensis TaxID=908809 RepID=A0A0R3JT27_CALMK|nr:Nif3-like dinuclear metal center hexameric protein [Caloramator mitchellensis]KRQ86635.1 putative GTP cyclohydrolase 1 type 2 [Caloramator mitchellensis]
MSLSVLDIISFLENKYPIELAEDFDNVGLLLGTRHAAINKILFTLDITDEVIDEAIQNNCNLIISHHPMIFKSIKRIMSESILGSMISKCIKNDINIYALHTNFDNANDGLNDFIASKINLNDISLLSPSKETKLYKLVVYVPQTHAEVVREALLEAGAGHIGNYSHCSFNTVGTGTFMPLKDSNPYIGQINKIEYVDELKIETIVPGKKLSYVISNMLKVHPYEEVAYDVYPLWNKLQYGTGRVGFLDKEKSLVELSLELKEIFKLDSVAICGKEDTIVGKVAVVGGSGSSFISDAIKMECDCLITGDIKHHDALDAISAGLCLIDIGHYGSEFAAMNYLKDLIEERFGIETVLTNINTNPFKRV